MKRLHATLMYAQRRAVIDQEPSIVTFQVAQNSYSSSFQGTYTMHPEVLFGVASGIKGPPSSPHSSITSPVTWPYLKASFYPLTATSLPGKGSAGTVYLTDTKRSCTYALTCDASTGSLFRCYRYTSRWDLIS